MSLWRFAVLCLTLTRVTSQECEVLVAEPWPTPYLFVPRDSTVTINCTNQISYDFLSVDLASDSSDIQYRIGAQQLIDHSVYELPPIDTPPTLRLLINDTANNNGTKILCSTGQTTTLFVFEPTPFMLEVLDMDVNGINISWSQDSSEEAVLDAVQTFSLTVSHGSSSQVISLNDSFYYFTATEDAPPCEVYNFSVTATYVSATYTGVGCSTSGSKSTMLPSLADIVSLESSLEYVLMKTSSKIIFVVSFESSRYCEQYPVLNYTLEVKGPSSNILSQSVSPGVENVFHNLTENTIYSFSVLISNSVGVVSTNRRQFFTTDVQNVTATLSETFDAFIVQCDFITASNAQGCMVVLVGEVDNVTCTAMLTLERYGCEVLNVSYPLSCYYEIFAFDIESDGSVGTLAVPGVLLTDSTSNDILEVCNPTITSSTSSSHTSLILSVTVPVAVPTVIIIFLLSSLVVIIIYNKLRPKQGRHNMTEMSLQITANEVYGIVAGDNDIETTPSDDYEVIPNNVIETIPNEVYGSAVSTGGIETTPNEVYGVSTDGIGTTPNEVYGDGIETTPNEVYGVSTDGIETTPNELYGVGTDGIETTPNEVYGVSTDGIETTPNELYGVGTDGIETTPNELYQGGNLSRFS